MPDKPWIFRTYAGHSNATETNRLFRKNLANGQTGLSVAFDLPTQTGYDSDHPLARGEVGRVGVPVAHLGDMRSLFEGIPPAQMNTSMTINATAAWLLALYVAMAEEQGADRRRLSGTTQNDIVKEYLSRGTYVFPPRPSMRLTTDVIAFTVCDMPKWNPVNVCSYHLQEAGATPVQEIAYALAAAVAILDGLQETDALDPETFAQAVGRISFFVNAGMRFVTEICKLRAFAEVWSETCARRWNVTDERLTRFRYGVQVNSLGLTEQQPENNVHRIMIEMLAVTLSKRARARAVQLPAWNEARGLPRPWDQQWSLRMQQILACETDLLEFEDIFDGSHVIEDAVRRLKADAEAEFARIEGLGGALVAVENGAMKRALVESQARRVAAIEKGERIVVGVNAYTESEPSPLDGPGLVETIQPDMVAEQIHRLEAWRSARDPAAVAAALDDLRRAAAEGQNIMEVSIAAAKAGVTTGEWGGVLRDVFGEYRAPTGVAAVGPASADGLDQVREAVEAVSRKLGRRLKFLVGKPGLDGHSNGAEQIAVRARDTGMEVVYEGIRLTPADIANAAIEEGVHAVGLSILSGGHLSLVAEVIARMREAGLDDVPVVVGGIVPDLDAAALREMGVAAVYTPKDFRLNAIMADIVRIVDERAQADVST